MESSTKPHVVLLSSPGMGHLIPVLELAKRLVTLHNFDATVVVVTSDTSPAASRIIQNAMAPKLCDLVELSPPDISSLVDAKATVVSLLAVMMREIRPAFRSAISSFKVPPSALIVDLFGTESLVIADELKIPKYVYIASNARFVALTVYVPTLDKVVQGEYVDKKEPFVIPGCDPVQPEDVVDPMLDRTHQQYHEYVRIGEEIPRSDGILLNTWEELEASTLAALRDENLLGRFTRVPVYPIGPFTRPNEPSDSRTELFSWLDKQPSDSVFYISFGSGGTLSFEQMTEVAWGLELSGQRFIWVVRPPTIKTGDGSFFNVGNDHNDVSSYLPEGFLDRAQNLGRVIPQWASQVNILGHPSVGGILSHCGWNSALESITNGVPIVAWPLYAEQRLNATLLADELGVAIGREIWPSNGVVGREEIKMMVRRVMVDEEGNKNRAKVKKLKASAEIALSEGGSSYVALSQFTKTIHEEPAKGQLAKSAVFVN